MLMSRLNSGKRLAMALALCATCAAPVVLAQTPPVTAPSLTPSTATACTPVAPIAGQVAGTTTTSVAAPAPGTLAAAKSWGYQLVNLDPKLLAASPYDVLVIDYSRDGSDGKALTPAELAAIKVKPDGSKRIVLSYLSIGEAESYRYYWSKVWGWFPAFLSPVLPNWVLPSWRAKLNRDWGGNYAVRYWEAGWQTIILGQGGYLDRILKAGFDGVWLDKVDSSLEDVAAKNPRAKEDMLGFVKKIAERGRAARPGFLIFPQNGDELLDNAEYRAMIDGIGKESLFYGEDAEKKPNAEATVAARLARLQKLTAEGKTVLAVEYLDDAADIAKARTALTTNCFVPHFAERSLEALRVGDLPDPNAPKAGKSRK
jgi:cysteinyl-tRNA synthetase, unknown class